MVHESHKQEFIDALLRNVKSMYSDHSVGGKGSPDMGNIVTDFHVDRIMTLVNGAKGKVICGGKMNKAAKYVEPTIIVDPDMNSAVMKEEIFGPVIPVISYKNFDEVIKHINDGDKPLALYYYGKCSSNPNNTRLLNETSSGSYIVNETIIHVLNHYYGFGGVGASGYGRYGGYDGFKNWSNPKSVMIKPTMNVYPYTQLNPPFTPGKQSMIRKLIKVSGSQDSVVSILKWIAILVVFYLLWFKLGFDQMVTSGLRD